MTLTDQDARALTYLARRIRDETTGAGRWDEAGTYAVISRLVGRNLPITVEQVTRHASDPNAKTPGAILRPFVPDAPVEERRSHPPRRTEECRTHPGQWADSCKSCAAEHWTAERDPETSAPTGRDAALASMRAARAAAAAAQCPHLLNPTTCGTCRAENNAEEATK